ncbi:MAG: glycosyltransferase family 4 protein [Vicinamibacterales bacterium]
MVRVAVVADLWEERWTSMDLVADALASELAATGPADRLSIDLLRPSFSGHGARGTEIGAHHITRRLAWRYWSYPRWLRARAHQYDVVHIIDQSYAHLALEVSAPAIVTCHDMDAFSLLVDPANTDSKLPRWLVRRLLAGLQRASQVICATEATRADLRRHDLVRPERLSVVHLGVGPQFTATPDPDADSAIAQLLGPVRGDAVDLLHVGSTVPRKRVEHLLRVAAEVRRVVPQMRLLKAGGSLTGSQRRLARDLGVEQAVVELPFLRPATLAALYRRASAVLVTSEREGFCLPVVEALACGTPVVATDIPVLHETGGTAASFPLRDDPADWAKTTVAAVAAGRSPESRAKYRCLATEWASRFSWPAHAKAMSHAYRQLADAHRTATRALVTS